MNLLMAWPWWDIKSHSVGKRAPRLLSFEKKNKENVYVCRIKAYWVNKTQLLFKTSSTIQKEIFERHFLVMS